MTKTNPPSPFPHSLRSSWPVLRGLVRSVPFCFLLALSITLFSIFGNYTSTVIVHQHESVHLTSAHDLHDAPDDHHEEHHGDEDGEHHHHLTLCGGTTLFSVPLSYSLFSLHGVRVSPASFDDACPDGPVFDMVKPPQVA